MALTAVLLCMDRGDSTHHGFRSTFRDWAGEATAYRRVVFEHALSHRLAEGIEAAYQRVDFMAKNTSLRRDWADFCLVNHAKNAKKT